MTIDDAELIRGLSSLWSMRSSALLQVDTYSISVAHNCSTSKFQSPSYAQRLTDSLADRSKV